MRSTHVRHSRIHFVLTLIWAALAVPTVLFWHESILWVALISVYANFVGHWSSWEAAKAKEAADKLQQKEIPMKKSSSSKPIRTAMPDSFPKTGKAAVLAKNPVKSIQGSKSNEAPRPPKH